VPAEWIPELDSHPQFEAAVAMLAGYFDLVGFGPLGKSADHVVSTTWRTPTRGELLRAQPGDGE
jgi:hypothetical protein